MNKLKQYIYVAISILMVVCILFFLVDYLNYKIIALLLLLLVSSHAMVFDIMPTILSAILSAIIWNFLFIPPIFTFHISNPEDILMFIMYFIVALINSVLLFKLKKIEKKALEKEEKEKTLKLYNTLLNSLSHELKTPISAIIGSVDTLQELEGKLSNENRVLLLNEIAVAGLKLNYQVENLLNMSRLESGTLKPKLEWCDVNEEFYRIIKNNFQNNARINFQFNDTLPICKMDVGFLEQIAINIIKNALLYTTEDKKIIIGSNYSNNDLILTFQDFGKGIPSEHLPYIFDKFFRVPQTITGGTGLGLSIVKGFVDALNGKIDVKNNNPNGLKFDIFIPVETTFINNLKNE
ncbi:DUF4118 domain-containing protein [Flavobacterium sp. 20NA77.7]|uniref:histidine kinase n=1 Tax=Flavobacterium nakdongensis TaxID=3073563 RepID=A0ABY9RBJ4_9FLAO|nr:DUF4118 domain-containing protein [Flavobacterium sp. 20NA77.7]WMW78608.1 DUF4118 domain-containing protein [Flavobacterium sp. 20NA77.7]